MNKLILYSANTIDFYFYMTAKFCSVQFKGRDWKQGDIPGETTLDSTFPMNFIST